MATAQDMVAAPAQRLSMGCPNHMLWDSRHTLFNSHAVRSVPCPPGLAFHLALGEGLGNVLLSIVLTVDGLVLGLQGRHDLKEDQTFTRRLQVRLSSYAI